MKYTEQEKTEIINFYKTHTIKETKEKYNVAYTTIKCWIDPQFRKKQLEYLKQDYIKNGANDERVEYRKKNNKKKYKKNKEHYKKLNKQSYQKNKEKIKEYSHNYYRAHKKQLNDFSKQYRKERYKIDDLFRIKSVLRCRINQAFRDQHINKTTDSHSLLGCNITECKTHLESQFKEGMTWDNYGKWHIDHIKPCASFDLTISEEQKKCFHYTNLQPLWADDNLIKGDKFTLGIINCAAKKKDFACSANQMYDDSRMFRTLRDYCIQHYDHYLILSAHYGVVLPEQIIEPYKDTVMFVPNDLLHSGKEYKALNVKEKREWANNVVNDIKWSDYTEINFHCGGYYMEHLTPLLKNKNNVIIHTLPKGISNVVNLYTNVNN